MPCRHCQRDIPDDSTYCRFCGADQRVADAMPLSGRRLSRSPANGKLAGVCAGLAEYFDVDVVFVRVAWVVLSVVPGAIVGGILAYLAAWLVMPERRASTGSARPELVEGREPIVEVAGRRRLARSATDKKIGGVCGGLAEYLGVDATPVRLLWVILTILPGAFVGGAVAYIVAWIVMPAPPQSALAPAPQNGI